MERQERCLGVTLKPLVLVSGLVSGVQVSQPFCVFILPLASQPPGQAGLQVSAPPGHAARDPAAPATATAPGMGHGWPRHGSAALVVGQL